jgi:hypothetical protein
MYTKTHIFRSLVEDNVKYFKKKIMSKDSLPTVILLRVWSLFQPMYITLEIDARRGKVRSWHWGSGTGRGTCYNMKIMCNYQTMGEITRILSTVIHEEFYTF